MGRNQGWKGRAQDQAGSEPMKVEEAEHYPAVGASESFWLE